MLRGLVCDLAFYFWKVWDWGSGFEGGVWDGGREKERKRWRGKGGNRRGTDGGMKRRKI